jgi:hypothetical protein
VRIINIQIIHLCPLHYSALYTPAGNLDMDEEEERSDVFAMGDVLIAEPYNVADPECSICLGRYALSDTHVCVCSISLIPYILNTHTLSHKHTLTQTHTHTATRSPTTRAHRPSAGTCSAATAWRVCSPTKEPPGGTRYTVCVSECVLFFLLLIYTRSYTRTHTHTHSPRPRATAPCARKRSTSRSASSARAPWTLSVVATTKITSRCRCVCVCVFVTFCVCVCV